MVEEVIDAAKYTVEELMEKYGLSWSEAREYKTLAEGSAPDVIALDDGETPDDKA